MLIKTFDDGLSLYRTENEVGGYVYHADENGIVARIWDTALTDSRMLLEAIKDYESIKEHPHD